MGSSYAPRALQINKRGSDCSGVTGATNRTLTLSEMPLLSTTLIFVGGRLLHPTDEYTLAGNAITFLPAIDNIDYIRVVQSR